MDDSKILFVINDSARAIEAIYEPGAKAERFKTLDPSIKVGDMAVVQSGTRHGMTVVQVTATDLDVDFDGPKYLWIIQKIDKEGFQGILDKEGEAMTAVKQAELRKKREELRKAMFAGNEQLIDGLALTYRPDGAVTE